MKGSCSNGAGAAYFLVAQHFQRGSPAFLLGRIARGESGDESCNSRRLVVNSTFHSLGDGFGQEQQIDAECEQSEYKSKQDDAA